MTDPREFNRPQRSILPQGSEDRLGLALIALMREVWVIKDRMMVLEAVLEAKGIDVASAIEAFQPDATQAARMQDEGDAFVKVIMDTLSEASS